MKTAREMFEELGFYLLHENEEYITYLNIETPINWRIDFDNIVRCFDSYDKYFNSKSIPFDVYKAIQKQIEELGWNDEEC